MIKLRGAALIPVLLDRARAEDWLPRIEGGSVSLAFLDPPYRNVLPDAWDRQWKTEKDYIDWLIAIVDELRRVLAPNGSLYLCSGAALADLVSVKVVRPRFRKLSDITWAKGHADLLPGDPRLTPYRAIDRAAARSWTPETERILFCEQYGADSMALGESGYAAQCEELRSFVFEPLRAYLDGERRAAGITRKQINETCGFANGGMAGHYFSRSQWQLPRPEHYAAMQTLFNGDQPGGHLRREYEDLRREYEDLRREYEDLRRPFAVSADVPHTDVWVYPTVPSVPGRHPAEKPLAMLRDIIRASSRPGDLILDAFAGRATTAAACVDTGRRFVGCEADEDWHRAGFDRIEKHRAIAEQRPAARGRPFGSIEGPLFGSGRAGGQGLPSRSAGA